MSCICLARKEGYFLALAAEKDWPKGKPREKVQVLRVERRDIRHQLDQTEAQLETGRQVFYLALDLLERPQAAYCAGSEAVRSVLNRAFFTRLYVQGVDDMSTDTRLELKEPFDVLVRRTRTTATLPGCQCSTEGSGGA